jgi:hypothetical protein
MFQCWYMSEINPIGSMRNKFKVHGHGHHENQKSWILLYTCVFIN